MGTSVRSSPSIVVRELRGNPPNTKWVGPRRRERSSLSWKSSTQSTATSRSPRKLATSDFIECLKLYDKMENGTMMLGELEHILLSLGEKLEREEVDILIKECCDPEDDDGFIPYEPFLRRVCAGPHPELYEDW